MDVIAGLTVGLTTVPQALAYAEVAGLPVQVSERATWKCMCNVITVMYAHLRPVNTLLYGAGTYMVPRCKPEILKVCVRVRACVRACVHYTTHV